MVKNITISLILLFSITLVSCMIDPLLVAEKDSSVENNDNNSWNGSFLTEKPPTMVDGNLEVADDMLRPFQSNYVSPYNYVVSNNFVIVGASEVVFTDDSLSETDPCTKEFYDRLTPTIFRHNDRIYITNRKQLNEFNRIYTSEYGIDKTSNTFILAKDIDLCSMTEPGFRPLGIPDSGIASFFWATFDGDNHIIKNLYVKRDRYAGFDCAGFICGLPGDRESGKLQNLGISGRIEISSDWADVNNRGAGVVGWTTGGEIKNVVSNLHITASRNVGGIVGMVATGESADGFAKPAHIENVKNYGNLTGQSHVGGIVGFAKDGNNINSAHAENIYDTIVNWGKITATNMNTAGGLFGRYENFNNIKPKLCRNGGTPTKLYGQSTVSFNNCDE